MRAGSNPAGGTYPPLPSTRAFFGKRGEVSSMISPKNDAAPAGHPYQWATSTRRSLHTSSPRRSPHAEDEQHPPVTQAEDEQHPPVTQAEDEQHSPV